MATLYDQKEKNIHKTWFLMTGFLVFIVFITWVFAQIYGNPTILYFGVIFAVLMNFFSYWYSDKIVLSMTHAQPVERKEMPELYNIVENLAITAGLPMPKIYLVDEAQPNAFATGRNPEHAVVAVTRGLLQKLNKTEIEGVVSHELSHVGNRDILLSTVIVVLVGFISILSDLFLRSTFFGFRRNNDREEGSQLQTIIMIIGLVLAILAPIAAWLIQLAISRRRESLADASGALLTRYPEGLASALEKISKDPMPMSVANNTTAHLWLDDPFKGEQKTLWLHKLFMTHPPINERIEALRNMDM